MTTIDFKDFYNNEVNIYNCYELDEDKYYVVNCYDYDDSDYIDSDMIDFIIDRLRSIILNIDNKIIDNKNKSTRYEDYLNAMKGLIERELELKCKLQNALNKFTNGDRSSDIEYIDYAKYVLSKELNIIPVIKAIFHNSPGIDIGIFLNSNKKDYTGNKQELFKLIQKEQNDNKITEEDIYNFIDEDIYKDEDKTLMRQLVLKFEHPDNYINEFGDYNYTIIKYNFHNCLFSEKTMRDIKNLARSFMFRSKTRRHFEYLNRAIPYEYTEMKESRKLLHSELRSLYKIFQRRMVDIPLAIAIKNE